MDRYPGQPGSRSPLRNLNPLTCLNAAVCATLASFLTGSFQVPGLLYLGVLLPAAAASGHSLQLLKRSAALLLPFSAVLFAVYGFLSPDGKTVLLAVGPLEIYREGTLYAALVSLRVLVMTSSFLLLVFLVPAHRLATALNQANVPWRLTFVLTAAFELLPQLRTRAVTIQDAQRARGLKVSGSVKTRVIALAPLVRPLVVSTFIDVEERAMALEARGFNSPGKKTSLDQVPDRPWERLFRRVLWLAVAGLAGVRLWN